MKLLFSAFDEISQIEQDRRTFQDGIDRIQRAIDQTLTLIPEAKSTQARAHVWAMLSGLEVHTQNFKRRAA